MSSEALERVNVQAIRNLWPANHHRLCSSRGGSGKACDCYMQSYAEAGAALDALLAEVARLEQERDEALSVREGLVSPVQKVLQLRDELAVARERAEQAEKERDIACSNLTDEVHATAVARERDQRAVDALRELVEAEDEVRRASDALTDEDDNAAMMARLATPTSRLTKAWRIARAALADEPAAATLAEPGRRDASTPAVGTGDASLPGSASAAADERPVDHRIPGSQTANPAGSPKVARTFDLEAAADEPGEAPA